MRLYKYYKNSDISYKSLVYQGFLFSTPAELNDPMDGKIHFVHDLTFSQWLELTNKYLDENEKLILNPWEEQHISVTYADSLLSRHDLQELFRALHLITGNQRRYDAWLIHVPKDCGYTPLSVSFTKNDPTHHLMWSHYASGHEGFALAFNINRNIFFKKHGIFKESEGLFSRHLFPMQYVEAPYVLTHEESRQFDPSRLLLAEFLSGKISKEANLRLREIFNRKYKAWDYENEWRLSVILSHDDVPETPEERIVYYPLYQLDSIYLGHKMSALNKKRIFYSIEKITAVTSKPIKIYMMEESFEGYTLIPKLLHPLKDGYEDLERNFAGDVPAV